IALCDGKTAIPLASSQDHKRALDGDKGSNTGGMGAYSPAPIVTKEMTAKLMQKVIEPTLSGMRSRNTPFTGFLYAGIMIDERTGEPFVLEFNARMGDPECQAVMMRMGSDLYPFLDSAVREHLGTMQEFSWTNETSVCVVMASKGYPGNYNKGE